MEKEHLEVILESIDSKFDLVIEGYNTLDRKIDTFRAELKEDIALCNVRIDALGVKIDNVESRLSEKIDAVAADLSAHRADTEAHTIYRVRET
ncbi:hypothetical protein [Pelovirga terrestris]|uniref:Uncharacterized protein n=1 Tax=Pelovirga terrestris TaxID=2771352 RepID=A0A8J6ULH2_9BACT|nr:hypothetical protein [Pelovirga terrestris]MBD1401147.1 hypothetical protein [Pelovirga terrestris]